MNIPVRERAPIVRGAHPARVFGEQRDEAEDRFVVDVTFRLAGKLGAPVIAEFTCPGPRTAVIEATIATSGRPGFAMATKIARSRAARPPGSGETTSPARNGVTP